MQSTHSTVSDKQLLENYMVKIQEKADKVSDIFIALFFCIGLALSPIYQTWTFTLITSLSTVSLYLMARFLITNKLYARMAVSVVYAVFMLQFIGQMHGMAEMHFFFFINIALLIVYQDWRIMLPYGILTVAHHAILAYFQVVYDMPELANYFITYGGITLDGQTKTVITLFQLSVHFGLVALMTFICAWWTVITRKNSINLITKQIETEKLILSEEQMRQNAMNLQEMNQRLQASEEEIRQNLEELQATQENLLQSQAEQQKFVSLIENVDAFIAITDLEGKTQYLNQAGKEMSSFNENYKGKSISEFHNEEDAKRAKEVIIPTVMEKGQWKGEHKIQNQATKQMFSTLANVFLIKDPNKKVPIAIATVQTDITERKQKEADNQLLQTLINNTSDAVQVATTDGRFIYMNTVGMSRLGLQGEDITNYTTADTESIFKEEGVWQGHVEEVKAVDTFVIQSTNRDKTTGKEFPVEVSIKYTEINDKGFMVAVSRDITEQKKREKEIQEKNKQLQASEEELQQNFEELQTTQEQLQKQKEEIEGAYKELQSTQKQLIQAEKMASLGQLVASIAHEINTPLGAIRSSAESIEVSLVETLPTLPSFIRRLDEKTLALFNDFVEKAIQKTESLSSKEKRMLKYDLIEEFESLGLKETRYYADTIIDMNMHDEKEIVMQLLKSNHSNEIKKETFEVAFNLSSIIRSNQTIKEATNRAAKTVFALKNFAHQDHTGEKTDVNLNETIETTLTLYHNQIKQGIDVIRDFDEIPSFLGYPDELMQVWTNLIHNSIQAMKGDGKLIISTKNQVKSVIISIQDTGGGIPKEFQEKIFDAFFTTKAAGEGSGLGLDITKKIIEKHQGKIWFETEEGIGTTFFVELPST